MAQKLSKKTTKIKKVVKKVRKAAKKSSMNKVASSTVVNKSKTFTIPSGQYTEGIGRRKVATARVRIYKGKGDFVVNDLLVGEYFLNVNNAHVIYNKPFEVTGTLGNYSVSVKVSGSGVKAQLEAVVLGIARALLEENPDFRPLLKAAGLLTRDDRMKESRKIGTGGKARRKRQSPKR